MKSMQPAVEIAALAKSVEPEDDPETNYFAASHLAYCGQTTAALQMLRRTVQANYCAYPAMEWWMRAEQQNRFGNHAAGNYFQSVC